MEAVAATGSEQEVSVGNLVLEVVARQVAALLLGAGVAAASSPPSLEAGDLASAAITMSASGETLARVTNSEKVDAAPSFERDRGRSASAAASSAAQSAASAAHASRSVPQDAMEQTLMRRLKRAALWTAPLAVVVFAVAALFTVRPTAPVTVQLPAAVTVPQVNAPGPAAASVPRPTPPAASASTPPLLDTDTRSGVGSESRS